MFQKLVSHNDDIRRLVEKGYAVAFDSGYMVIRDIPYLDKQRAECKGAIISKIDFVDKVRVRQHDHQIFFAGGRPHNADGTPIPNLGGGGATLALSDACNDIRVERSFSNKPFRKGQLVPFADFFEKVESYVAIIAGPAIELHGANPLTFRVNENVVTDPIFKFHDTLTSRAEIGDLNNKLRNDVVAIIGLGGTGGYILDYLVKAPIPEIRAFDLDNYHVHNAYRSPGRLIEDELGKPKADVYAARYENFRNGLSCKRQFVDLSAADELNDVTFAFVSVDKGSSRAGIFDLLTSKKIPFIDAGMGLNRKKGPINGMLRATYYDPTHAEKMRDMNLAELSDAPDEIYRSNIQIGELNALNAALAVIRYKQLRGFYFAEDPYYNLLLEIGDLKIVEEHAFDEN